MQAEEGKGSGESGVLTMCIRCNDGVVGCDTYFMPYTIVQIYV